MKLREDQQRLKDLLKDTITLLCKNGLQYKDEFSVEALIGITLDHDNVFLVNIKETIQTASKNGDEGDSDTNESSEQAPSPKSARKRPHGGTVHSSHITPSKQQRLQSNVQNQGSFTSSPQPVYNIKTEITEDNDEAELVFVKEEQNTFHIGHSSGGPSSVPYPVSFGSSVVNIAGHQGPGDPTGGGGIGTANLVNTSLDSSTYLQQSPNMWSMGGQKASGNQQFSIITATIKEEFKEQNPNPEDDQQSLRTEESFDRIKQSSFLRDQFAAVLTNIPEKSLEKKPHKSYPIALKLEAVHYAETSGVSKEAVARKYCVDSKRIRDWCKQKKHLQKLMADGFGDRKKILGGGRKPAFESVENGLIIWMTNMKAQNIKLSRKMIQDKAVEIFHCNPNIQVDLEKGPFLASKGWLEKFFKRNDIRLSELPEPTD